MPAHAPPLVPLLHRRITNPTFDQTPVAGSALHPDPHRPPTYHARLPLPGLPSGQTLVRGLPLLLLEQSAAVHSPAPVVSVRVRLPEPLSAHRCAQTAIAALFLERPVADGIVMTGEITLSGNMLPVGGIKEKVLAAYRGGLRTIILPCHNEVDLEDLPERLRN